MPYITSPTRKKDRTVLAEALHKAKEMAQAATPQDWLDTGALATSLIPVVGDVAGLVADGHRFVTEPESRTPLNFGLSALGVLPFVPSGLGMLRKGGREDLMPWHGTDVKSLREVLGGPGQKELYSPSIGISKDTIPSTWTGAGNSVTLIPKVGAFDPSTYPTTLFNRDAYTPRKDWYEGFMRKGMGYEMSVQKALDAGSTAQDILRTEAQLRLADRTRGGSGLRGLEQEGNWSPSSGLESNPSLEVLTQALGSAPQAVATKASPAFRSFESFERHPLGAALLDSRYEEPGASGLYDKFNLNTLSDIFRGDPSAPLPSASTLRGLEESLGDYDRVRAARGSREALLEAIEQPGGLAGIRVPEEMLDQVMENPSGFIRSLDKYNNALAKSPSGYAELKAAGPIPVNSEHWAGAMFPQGIPGNDPAATNRSEALAEALLGQGIPSASVWMPPSSFLDKKGNFSSDNFADVRFQLADELQKATGHARRSPL